MFFYLTRVSNFHDFSIEITENHVFATLVIKISVFPRFVEKSTLVATLVTKLKEFKKKNRSIE